MASVMLHSWMNVEQAEVLNIYEDREEDDSSEAQVVPSGEKAQLLKQMLPMLHDIHAIGAKLDVCTCISAMQYDNTMQCVTCCV